MGEPIKFQRESWPAIIGEAMPMLRLYWNTGGEIHGKEFPMEPDLDLAMGLHSSGRLRIFTARSDALLIGLNSFNVGPTLYRRNTMTAIALILYVLPSERRGSMGYRFLRETDSGLAEMGVKLVQYVPGATVDISPLLMRLGYKRAQGTFEKML
jgi:hypothetical protein